MPNRLIVSIKIIALKKASLYFLLLASMVHLSACTTHYGAANIVSSPAGAEVVNGENNEVLGHTPLTVHWQNSSKKRQTIILKLEKSGYYPKTSSFWLEMRSLNAKAAKQNAQLVEIEMQKIGE